MVGKIIVHNRSTWRAPDWVVRNLIADCLLALTSAYARERKIEYSEAYDKARSLESQLESALDRPTASLDMSHFSGPDIRAVYRTVVAALESTYEKGARRWFDPESFPQFTALVEELLEKMKRDSRLQDLN